MGMGKSALEIYDEHFVKKGAERIDLFRLLAKRFGIRSALYPGSFVHVAPSLAIPKVTYIDIDRRCPKFFTDPTVHEWVIQHRDYSAQPDIAFMAADYLEPLALSDETFDLLISQWAGPISQACKRYLSVGGILLVNDSHGDASLAWFDEELELIATISNNGDSHSIDTTNLENYFVPKARARTIPTTDSVLASQRGPAYQETADSYLFRRVEPPISR